jgi:hypothetical protein
MLSREFLLKRGHCCHLGCFNCPYGDDPEGLTKQPEDVKLELSDESSNKKEKE